MTITHSIYKQSDKFEAKVDEDCCREEVWGDFRSHQCNRKAKVFEDVEMNDGTVVRMGFCKQHSREYREEKERRRQEVWEIKERGWKREREIRETKDSIVTKVKEIHGLPETDVDGRDFCFRQLMNMAERLKAVEKEKP